MESSSQGERNLVPLPALYKKKKEGEKYIFLYFFKQETPKYLGKCLEKDILKKMD